MRQIKPYADLSLAERYKRAKTNKVLLLDISASMHSDVEPGTRKIDALRNIVKKINAKMFAFDDGFEEVKADRIPEPRGNTCLSGVLNHIKNRGIKEAIILTDGEVSLWDQDATLRASEGIKLQIMYIGSGAKPDFLSKLANYTGGECTVEDLTMQKELEEKVQQLLLTSGDEETKGAIEL